MQLTQAHLDILSEITADGFDPSQWTFANDQAVDDKKALIEEINVALPSVGCMIGCYPAYLDCVKSNPSYPGRAICDTYLSQCIAGCSQQ